MASMRLMSIVRCGFPRVNSNSTANLTLPQPQTLAGYLESGSDENQLTKPSQIYCALHRYLLSEKTALIGLVPVELLSLHCLKGRG